jgi:hypothetical protein
MAIFIAAFASFRLYAFMVNLSVSRGTVETTGTLEKGNRGRAELLKNDAAEGEPIKPCAKKENIRTYTYTNVVPIASMAARDIMRPMVQSGARQPLVT